ncbi:hypothetical protein KAR91_06995 [Candidatus Pacearchaeota archaeon]|nr:hypothetical protein [Candidatus Pacearchaeota archaeon]
MQTQPRYMKIKILEIFEKEGLLRVKTECDYGFDDIGMSLDKKKIDAITGIPKWQLEVKMLLEKQYKNAKPIKEKSLKEFEGKIINLDKI